MTRSRENVPIRVGSFSYTFGSLFYTKKKRKPCGVFSRAYFTTRLELERCRDVERARAIIFPWTIRLWVGQGQRLAGVIMRSVDQIQCRGYPLAGEFQMQCLLYFPTHVFFFRVDAKVSLVSSVYRPFDGAIAYRFSPATYQRAIVPVCHLQQENVFNWISSFILNLLYKKRIESPKGMSSESSRLSGTMRLLLLERIISIERAG